MTNDRFQRWQKITINHFSYAQNLILTFTVAALGYWFVLLRDKEFNPAATAKCVMLLALAALGLSAVSGLYCVVNRLSDFRGTAQRAREAPSAPDKEHLVALGKLSWGLFYTQIVSFGVGVALLAIALLLTDGRRVA